MNDYDLPSLTQNYPYPNLIGYGIIFKSPFRIQLVRISKDGSIKELFTYTDLLQAVCDIIYRSHELSKLNLNMWKTLNETKE